MLKRRSFQSYPVYAILLSLLFVLWWPKTVIGQYTSHPPTNNARLATNLLLQPRTLPRPVRVGFYENPPKLFTNTDGSIEGFWPDLINDIAAEENWEVIWVPGTWEENLGRLEHGEIDIMPDVAWSEPRSQIYAFSNQKVIVSWSRLYAAPNVTIETVLDLEGKSVAGLVGSVNYDGPEGIKDLVNQFDVQTTFVDKNNYTEVFEAIQNGSVDAGVTNRDFGNQNESIYDVERTSFIFQPAHIEFAFPKNGEFTPLLQSRIDSHIKELKADEASVYYASIEKYLEGETAETIVEITPDWVQNLFLAGGGVLLFLLAVGITSRVQVWRRTEALRKSEENYRILFEHATDGIFIADQTGQYIDVNARGCDLLGYSRQELLKLLINDLVAPEDLAISPVQIQELLAGETIISERLLLHKDGSKVPVEISSRLMPDGKLQGIVRNISERKLAEQALQSQVDWNKLLLKSMLDGYILADTEGQIIEVNPSYCNMIGYSFEELVAMNIRQIEAQLSSDTVDERIRRMVEDGTARFETQHRAKDGRLVDLEVSTVILQQGENTPLISAFVRDITERKQAEKERGRLSAQIREQAAQLEQVLETVPTGVMLLDHNGQILLANPTASKEIIPLIQAKVGDLFTGLGSHSLNELLTSPPTQGLWHEVKAQKRIFRVIARPVETSSEPGHWVLAIDDVTRDREIRYQLQQQERLATVGQLAAGIAHDFNNIMATIILYSQMLARSEGLTQRERERLITINEQAWHASRLIEQILDFSRQAMLELHPLDLLPLLKEQVKLLKRTLPEHIRVDLNYTVQDYVINADPTRMQQIITNLAVNARDAMPEGGSLRFLLEKIVIKPNQADRPSNLSPGDWIILRIRDNGTGISAETMPRIFEPFFTTKGPGAGSGLGLAQVHGIVGQHGGHIIAESQPGTGTTFTIYLPALDVTPAEPLAVNLEAYALGKKELILVVEDEATLRKALVSTLKELNYRTLEAINGRDALNQMTEWWEQIDLVLSDVIMPEMGGKALFYALRERGWQKPVVLLTGHPMDKQFAELQTQGLTAWMAKPPNLVRLAHTLALALREKPER